MQRYRILGLVGTLTMISGCAAAYPCPGNPTLNCYPAPGTYYAPAPVYAPPAYAPPGVVYEQQPGVQYVQPPGVAYDNGYDDSTMMWDGSSYGVIWDPGFGWGFYDPHRHWHPAPYDMRDRLDHRFPGGHGWEPGHHGDFGHGPDRGFEHGPGGPGFGHGPGGPGFPGGGQNFQHGGPGGGFGGHPGGGPNGGAQAGGHAAPPAGHPGGGGGGGGTTFGPFTAPR